MNETMENTISRGVREAIYIKALAPSLNQNLGRHALPPIFDDVIKRLGIRRPPPPDPHRPEEPLFNASARLPGRPRNVVSASQPSRKRTFSNNNNDNNDDDTQGAKRPRVTGPHHPMPRRDAGPTLGHPSLTQPVITNFLR